MLFVSRKCVVASMPCELHLPTSENLFCGKNEASVNHIKLNKISIFFLIYVKVYFILQGDTSHSRESSKKESRKL